MKKILISVLIGLILGAVLTYVLLDRYTGEKTKTAEKTSFNPVTDKLDPGGSLYLYADTQKVVGVVEKYFQKIRTMVDQFGEEKAESQEVLLIIDLIHSLFVNSGLTEISGIGLSSVPIESDLNHTTFVVHHYKDKGNGLIWKLSGEGPHKIDMLDYLPSDTVLAFFVEKRFDQLWRWVEDRIEESNIPDVQKSFTALGPQLQSMGIELNRLIKSISGQMGYIVTLDKEKTMQIPVGASSLEIPHPGFALVFEVKNSYPFELLKSLVPEGEQTEEDQYQIIKIPVPFFLSDIEPAIIYTKEFIILTTHQQVVDRMLASKEEGNGLKTLDEFTRLSSHMPEEGNGFSYVSNRIYDVVLKLQTMGMNVSGTSEQEQNFTKEIMGLFPKSIDLYGVLRNEADGLVYTVNHSLGTEFLMLMPMTSFAGIIAAVVIPNYLSAIEKGKQKETSSLPKL